MIQVRNIRLIGTSHISGDSVREVKRSIADFKPDVVAVELDGSRLSALETKKRAGKLEILRRVGFTGFLFAFFGEIIQKYLGKAVGMDPGKEMLTAVREARKENIKIALIDQDIEVTLYKFSRRFTFREKMRFIWDLIRSPFMKEEKLNFDLTKVPSEEIISEMVGKIRERYPNLYDVLIDERNRIMARRLQELEAMVPGTRVVAVVGAGHIAGIRAILEEDVSIEYTFSTSS